MPTPLSAAARLCLLVGVQPSVRFVAGGGIVAIHATRIGL
jgi:hypothetical protein